MQPATSWKLGFTLLTGTVTVGAMVLLRTLPCSASVVDSTPIKVGGNASFTLSPGQTFSDTISVPLDYAHGYAVVVYFTAGSGEAVPQSSTTAHACGYLGGDQTGLTTLPSYLNFQWSFFSQAIKVS